MVITDATAATVRRVASLLELPDDALRCAVDGHGWSDPPVVPIRGWGNALVAEMRFTCPCGRWKREVIADDGDILSRAYGGGTMIVTGARVLRADARAERIRRKNSRRGSRP